MRHLAHLLLLLALLAVPAAGQTTAVYDLATATPTLNGTGPMVCSSGPENCYYEIANGSQSGVFETGGYWTQFDYRAYPGQNPGYNADYCNGTAVWSVVATPNLGPTAYLYAMDCQATDLHGVPSTLHAEIYSHSFVATYVCGGRVRTICHQTRWQIDPGSLLAITK
ncbi:MAG TPA: hypothetical protein VL403_20690 [Candidatus Kryptonia bacterium]|nr:hypothetical protein [Candidatus Kryptonia bacterium]